MILQRFSGSRPAAARRASTGGHEKTPGRCPGVSSNADGSARGYFVNAMMADWVVLSISRTSSSRQVPAQPFSDFQL
jgi:hypothetical protein